MRCLGVSYWNFVRQLLFINGLWQAITHCSTHLKERKNRIIENTAARALGRSASPSSHPGKMGFTSNTPGIRVFRNLQRQRSCSLPRKSFQVLTLKTPFPPPCSCPPRGQQHADASCQVPQERQGRSFPFFCSYKSICLETAITIPLCFLLARLNKSHPSNLPS